MQAFFIPIKLPLYICAKPPSIYKSAPAINEALSDAKKNAVCAISRALAIRLKGVLALIFVNISLSVVTNQIFEVLAYL